MNTMMRPSPAAASARDVTDKKRSARLRSRRLAPDPAVELKKLLGRENNVERLAPDPFDRKNLMGNAPDNGDV